MKTDNELIAEFMGFQTINLTPIDKQGVYKILDNKGNPVHPYYGPHRSEQMQFDSSWDWLMPVWFKCKEIGIFAMTHGFDKIWLEHSKKIESTIVHEVNCERAAIQISYLIKWYNTQNS